MKLIYFQYWQNSSGKWNFRMRDTASNHNIGGGNNQGYENEDDCISTMHLHHGSKLEPIDIRKVQAP